MAGWAALILVVLPLAHAAGPVGLALDTTCTNAECYKQRNMTLLKQALLANYDMTIQPGPGRRPRRRAPRRSRHGPRAERLVGNRRKARRGISRPRRDGRPAAVLHDRGHRRAPCHFSAQLLSFNPIPPQVYFDRFGAMAEEEEFKGTKINHVAPADF